MRIKEEFKGLGYFWLPSAPNRVLPGILSISDGGNIELEALGLFDDGEIFLNDELRPIGRIVGHIEDNRLVTLNDCYYKTGTMNFGGISKSLIHVGIAFTGVQYDENTLPLFNTLAFSIDGIDEWVGISGINVDYQLEEHTSTISYQPPENIPLHLGDGMQLSIAFGWTAPGFPIIKEARITQKAYFQLVSQEARELDDFISVVRKITHFLCFTIDQTVSLDSMSATSDDLRRDIGDGTTKPIPINIYYPSRPYSEDEPKIRQHDMLFGFGRIQSDVQKKIKNWIEAYEETYPAFDLYFSARTGEQSYLDDKFLTLARGLEAYHKRKFDEGSVPLDQRIKCIIEPFKTVIGDEAKQNDLINKIAQKRNDLTHSNLDLDPQTADNKDLWTLYLKIELLFQLRLLWSIGFNLEDINSIVANCGQLQWKLNQQL